MEKPQPETIYDSNRLLILYDLCGQWVEQGELTYEEAVDVYVEAAAKIAEEQDGH